MLLCCTNSSIIRIPNLIACALNLLLCEINLLLCDSGNSDCDSDILVGDSRDDEVEYVSPGSMQCSLTRRWDHHGMLLSELRRFFVDLELNPSHQVKSTGIDPAQTSTSRSTICILCALQLTLILLRSRLPTSHGSLRSRLPTSHGSPRTPVHNYPPLVQTYVYVSHYSLPGFWTRNLWTSGCIELARDWKLEETGSLSGLLVYGPLRYLTEDEDECD